MNSSDSTRLKGRALVVVKELRELHVDLSSTLPGALFIVIGKTHDLQQLKLFARARDRV